MSSVGTALMATASRHHTATNTGSSDSGGGRRVSAPYLPHHHEQQQQTGEPACDGGGATCSSTRSVFGSPRLRSSCHERLYSRRRDRCSAAVLSPQVAPLCVGDVIVNRHVVRSSAASSAEPAIMFRSSSSLELDQHATSGTSSHVSNGVYWPHGRHLPGSVQRPPRGGKLTATPVSGESGVSLRREFGSHGSIDVAGRGGRYYVTPASSASGAVDRDSVSSSCSAVLKDFRSLDPELTHGERCVDGRHSSASTSGDTARCSPTLRSCTTGAASSTTTTSSSSTAGGGGGVGRFQRLWETRERRASRKMSSVSCSAAAAATLSVSSCAVTTSSSSSDVPSIFRRLRGATAARDKACTIGVGSTSTESSGSDLQLEAECRQLERRRRRLLVHYDWPSLLASVASPANPASPHHPQLPSSSSDAATASSSSAVRHNTATGASAAAAACSSSSSSSSSQQETHPAASTTSENDVQSWHNSSPSNVDGGDGRSNELVESCAFFRNELGGERERCVSLMPQLSSSSLSSQRHHIHRPAAACYLSVLEQPHSLTVWPVQQCPFSRASQPLLETASLGAFYYKDFFHAKPHENWLGVDDIVGPVCISVRRDRVVSPTNDLSDEVTDRSRQVASHSCFRVIIRCSQLSAVRGLLLEESVVQMSGSGSGGKSSSSSNSSSNSSSSSKHQRLPVREILDHVAPNINTSCLRLATQDVRTEDYIMKLDEQNVSTRYKVGVMYCRAGQCTEEQMYSNETAGPAFNEFLEMIGQRVRLRGFDKYKAGLDNKSDTTGQYSVYTLYQGNEIMFHVSTMLQYCPNNRQQLLRKRYIGNDIVTLIFQEPGAAPFSPKYIRSQFQHVFIVVRAINPCSGPHTKYRVAVNRFHSVPAFGPPLSESAVYSKGKQLADLICAKVINAENAAFRSEKFMTMACRTRQEYLKDLAANYASDTSLDQQQKFSLMSFSGRKKERPRVRFLPDICQRGAIAWPVLVDEHGSNNQLRCVLGISADAVVLADEIAGDLVFAAPSCSILAWSLHANSLRVFYHHGECVILYPRSQADTAELAEIAARLAIVSHAAETQELMLRRNVMGQLGLHVQQDGVVSEVEPNSSAWQQGLRPAARIVQICKVAVCSMTYEQMVDLLKTSPMVTVCVVPPNSLDNCSVRLGCTMAACGRVSPPPPVVAPPSNTTTRCLHMPPPQQQQQQQHCPSPAGSSGYVTAAGSGGDGAPLRARGSSDTSGTLSSTCSSSSSSCGGHGVSSRPQVRGNGGLTPPPLPCRLRQTGGTVTSSLVVAGDHVPSHHLSHQDITHSSDRFSTVQSVGAGLVDQTNSLSLSSCLSSSVSRHITSSRLTKWPPPPSTSSSAAGISACQSHDNLNMLSCDPAPLQHHHDQVEAVSGASVSQLTSMLQQRISSTSSSSTSSASCTSSRRDTAGNNVSALQKELLRLISPSPPLPAVVSSCSSDLVDDVIITAAARPAVSVTPAPSGGGVDNHTHTEDVQIDWRRLVQLAEEAGDTHDISRPNGKLTDNRSLLSCHSSPVQNNNNNNISGSLSDRVTTTLKAQPQQQQLMNMHVSPSIRDDCQLRDRIASLQHELVNEQDRRQSLEHQVRQLSKDNRRLQDESRQAAQQLRKFTEWFFANFEKS